MRLSVDSNILVYVVDPRDPIRQASALAIVTALSRCDSVLTLQALAEFPHVPVRKRIASPETVRAQHTELVNVFRTPAPSSLASLERAVLAWEAGRFAFWDAMLLAAAGAAGCEAVISADMHDGAALDRVRVIGAFDAQGSVSPAARAALGIT